MASRNLRLANESATTQNRFSASVSVPSPECPSRVEALAESAADGAFTRAALALFLAMQSL